MACGARDGTPVHLEPAPIPNANERDQDSHLFLLEGLRFVQKIFSTLNTILSPSGRFLAPSS
jgi:hypothetical protein